jgi:Dolichyl-phosphate-mannose-protein mannosyltransferase
MLAVAGVMRAIDLAQRVLAIVEIHPDIHSTTSVAKHFIARVLSAASGVATVAVLYHAATRLAGRRVGLASAALLAFAFLHVRDSHFGVTDVPMTFMLFAAFAWVVRLSESGETRDLVGAALLAGLATATKYNAALVAVPATFALLIEPTTRPMGRRLWRVVLFGALMLSTFLLVAPFSVVEYRQLFEELLLASQHLSGGHGPDLGRGWTYHLGTTLRYGLGLPLLVTGIGGLLLMLRRQPRMGILVALFPVAYYAVAGSGYTVFARHMQPVVPFFCFTAGYAITTAAEWLTASLGRPAWMAAVLVLGVAIVLGPSAASVFRFDRLLARTDSRLLARRWIEKYFREGTTIAQPGRGSGRVMLQSDNELSYVPVELTTNGPRPDLVVQQSSPLFEDEGSSDAESMLAAEYDLGLTLHVADADPANVYDRQDDFYLPMSGFRRIDRPGPNLQIYVRRGALSQ